MAIPQGKGEQIVDPAAATYRRRVVIKLTAGAALTAAGEKGQRHWKEFLQRFPSATVEPYFTSLPAEQLNLLSARGATASDAPAAGLSAYAVVNVPEGEDPFKVLRMVEKWPNVEEAYVESGPTPPPVDPSDDPFSASQGYLDAAPKGIDARWAWTACDGHGVGMVDLERGWTLNHEDLIAANITLISGLNTDFHGHGTAVLGEIVGVDNKLGVIGVAPRASTRVVSQWRTATVYNTGDAILSATAAMSAGDVLLLEAQTTIPPSTTYLPVEVELAVFDAIRAAVNKGIVVVEAGGNGASDLDAFTNAQGKKVLNRSSPDFRDSGAIMVGAGLSTAPHARSSFSNYGSRIDCYGWGDGIRTTGDGWTGTATNAYTASFGGTSGASPIVTGAAVLLQSWAKSHNKLYTPAKMRSLLSTPSLNTASANPSDKIGVMPNLKAIIQHELKFDAMARIRWELVVRILFGVTQDGGGVILKPGQGPVPIDPWGPMLQNMAPEKRDIIVGLAVSELASLLSNSKDAGILNAASAELLNRSIEKMSLQI